MKQQLKILVPLCLVIGSFSVAVAPARADGDDVLREIGRAIRREIQDDRGDRIREAICEDARGQDRRNCRRAERIDEVVDDIREENNRRRFFEAIFNDDD